MMRLMVIAIYIKKQEHGNDGKEWPRRTNRKIAGFSPVLSKGVYDFSIHLFPP